MARAAGAAVALAVLAGGWPLATSLHADSPLVLYETGFAGEELPAGWVERGGWTVQDGLRTPAKEGGYGCVAVWQKETALEQTLLEATVLVSDPESRLGLVRQHLSASNLGQKPAGTVGLLDGSTRSLRLLSAWDGTNAPATLSSVSLPSALVAGRAYRLSLWRTDPGHHAFQLRDTVTGEQTTVTALRSQTRDPGRQLDAPGFLFLSGAARVAAMTLSTPAPARPRLLIVGDSHTEGEYIKPYYDERYASLVARALGGNCVIASRSGESTVTVKSRLETDLARFHPDYVLLELGYNDKDFGTWRTNIQAFIAQVQRQGAVPLLATILPAFSRGPFVVQVNDWIRASGYRYVDFYQAVGVGVDGAHWDMRYTLADQTHPNLAGNEALYARFRSDLPEVFEAPPAEQRQLRLRDTTVAAGGLVSVPVELLALGNEDGVRFSVGFDPAAMAWHSFRPAASLPAPGKWLVETNAVAGGRVGFCLESPSPIILPAGTQTLVTLTFQSLGPASFPQTSVRLVDDPITTIISPLALESHHGATVLFQGRLSPVARWPLEGNGREVGNAALDGELLGAVPWAEQGEQALAFNGTGARVAVSTNFLPGALQRVTLSARAKPSELAGTHCLLTGESGTGECLFLRLNDGRFEAGSAADGRERFASAVLNLDSRTWVHLAAVHNGLTWKLYQDGVVVAEQAVLPPALQGAVGWTLGARRDGSAAFAGWLSDVRVYDRALAPAEVAGLAAGGEQGSPPARVLVDEELPAGAITNEYGGEGWTWITQQPPPYSGAVAHASRLHTGISLHYFRSSGGQWPLSLGDTLVAHVYPDPAHPPRMVMLQWLDASRSWEHRAYWGEPLWPYGLETLENRRCMGRLPPAGRWTRLEVPAAWVGLEGRSITGMSFVLYDGAAAWDLAGIASPALAEPAAVLGGPVLLPGGQLQFSVPTHPALATHVFGSSDLDHWTRLTTLAFPFAGGVFVDDPATGPPVRFYRLVQEPR